LLKEYDYLLLLSLLLPEDFDLPLLFELPSDLALLLLVRPDTFSPEDDCLEDLFVTVLRSDC
jgi:hypothetical protein